MTNIFDAIPGEPINILHKDGLVTQNVQTHLGASTCTIYDQTIDLAAHDKIERTLPNGRKELFEITKVEFHKSPFPDQIPSHWKISFQKVGAENQVHAKFPSISIINSQGIQIGDHNTQTIVESFKDVITRIDNGPGTPEEKKEAKSKLKAFLEHPLTSAIVGTALSGLLPSLN
jgi:hypothetical protein